MLINILERNGIASCPFYSFRSKFERSAVTLELTPPTGMPLEVAIETVEEKVAGLRSGGVIPELPGEKDPTPARQDAGGPTG